VFCVFLCCSLCLFLYGPFCHGALKLYMSTLFTTFFLWKSLQFILRMVIQYLLSRIFWSFCIVVTWRRFRSLYLNTCVCCMIKHLNLYLYLLIRAVSQSYIHFRKQIWWLCNCMGLFFRSSQRRYFQECECYGWSKIHIKGRAFAKRMLVMWLFLECYVSISDTFI